MSNRVHMPCGCIIVKGEYDAPVEIIHCKKLIHADTVKALAFCVRLIEELTPPQRMASGLYAIGGWQETLDTLATAKAAL